MSKQTIITMLVIIALSGCVKTIIDTEYSDYYCTVDGKNYNELIGDGVIIATPFGSTAYYKATGGKSFEKGIGISFNNLHNRNAKSFVVLEDSVVKMTVNRGPALLLADNNEKCIELESGDTMTVRKSESVANFIYVP